MPAWTAPFDPLRSSHSHLEDVSSILSWVSCYVLYIALLAEAHTEQVKSRVVYLTLIIADVRCNRSDRWLTYVAIFRSNAAKDPTEGWGKLDHRRKTTMSSTSGSHRHTCNVATYILYISRWCFMLILHCSSLYANTIPYSVPLIVEQLACGMQCKSSHVYTYWRLSILKNTHLDRSRLRYHQW